jgi:hypothetical protein
MGKGKLLIGVPNWPCLEWGWGHAYGCSRSAYHMPVLVYYYACMQFVLVLVLVLVLASACASAYASPRVHALDTQFFTMIDASPCECTNNHDCFSWTAITSRHRPQGPQTPYILRT